MHALVPLVHTGVPNPSACPVWCQVPASTHSQCRLMCMGMGCGQPLAFMGGRRRFSGCAGPHQLPRRLNACPAAAPAGNMLPPAYGGTSQAVDSRRDVGKHQLGTLGEGAWLAAPSPAWLLSWAAHDVSRSEHYNEHSECFACAEQGWVKPSMGAHASRVHPACTAFQYKIFCHCRIHGPCCIKRTAACGSGRIACSRRTAACGSGTPACRR